MKKLMNMLMISCRKSTELIDKRIHSGISRQEIMQLHFHTLMCSACRNYGRQSRIIDRVLKEDHTKPDATEPDPAILPEGFIDRVIHKLETW